MDIFKPRRELLRPRSFSIYKWFWRYSKWKRLILPDKAGFASARQNICFLEAKPGVYEFAISKGYSRRYKVYIGESGSIRKRHQTYAKTGDHLVLLFDAALKEGCTIWCRWRYVKTKQKAVAWEAYFLNKYDYAWNAQQNRCRRKVSIVSSCSCWCTSFTRIVEEHICVSVG